MKPSLSKPARQRRPSRKMAAALVSLAALSSSACSDSSSLSETRTETRTGRATAAISGGVADTAHPSVFLLVAHHEDSGSLCTATLIAPNLLLTARHCVSPGEAENILCGEAVLGEPYPPEAFFTTNDPRPSDASPFFRVAKIEVPVQGTDTCGYDIALVTLDSLVPTQIALPAVPRIEREVTPGELYTAVGYGVDENGEPNGSRMRREGLEIGCEPGSCGAGVESTEFRGEAGICSGDSGGPALDQEGKVVGVVSRGGPECGTPVYGTVTAWRDFILRVALDAAERGGYEPTYWVTSGSSELPPDPGAGGAAGSGGRAASAGEASAGEASAGGQATGSEGQLCHGSGTCDEGLVCYAAPNATSDRATCVASCTSTAECGAGLVCRDLGSASVCVAPSGGADDDGCSVVRAAAPQSSTLAWSWAALFGLVWAWRRKK